MKKYKMLFVATLLFFCCLFSCFTPIFNQIFVSASSINIVGAYTNVLDDLQKDENFNSDNYPLISDDYSLNLMHIAESNEKELFVYVYQPSANYKNLVATSLFLSTNSRGLDYKNYYLSLVNKQGVFYKYRLNDFYVSTSTTRDYEITSIYRKFDENIDKKLPEHNENIINEVEFKVAKHWTFTTTSSGVDIACHDIETIQIVDKYVGFCRYEDGYTGFPSMGFGFHEPGYDSHFVAFTTDRKIDDLLEADVFYTQQSYHWADKTMVDLNGGYEETFGEKEDKYAYLKGEYQVVEIPNGGSGSRFYWENIQTPEEFFATENREIIYEYGLFDVKKEVKLTDEGKKDIEGMDWILRFALTEYSDYIVESGNNVTDLFFETRHIEYSIVGDVSIIRLRFITDGIEYNLGVIDNKQQGDGNPDNYTKTTIIWSAEFKIILAILLLIILVVILAPILPTIFNVVFALFKIILKILIWILSIPIKLLKFIFKKKK